MSYADPALPFGLSGPAAAETDAFVARLAELPFAHWPAHATSGAYATAGALLDAALADQSLGVTTWYVRDLVETSAFLASCNGSGGRSTSPVRADRRRATCRLAEVAALALLVRPLLSAADFDTLYAPFANVLPRPTLVRDGPGRDPWEPRRDTASAFRTPG